MQERIYFDLSNIYQNLYQLDESYDLNKDNFDYIVLDYLISEGYTDNVEKASNIVESMSDDWYNLIIEEKSAAKKVTELRSQMGVLLKKIDPKNPDKGVVQQVKQIRERIKTLETHSSGERALSQITGSNPKPKPDSEEDAPSKEETKEYKAAVRGIIGGRRHSPEKSQSLRDQMAKRRRRQEAGRTQITKDEAPIRTTRSQAGAEAASSLFVDPSRDPSGAKMTYKTSSGEERPLNLTRSPVQIRTDATRGERRSGASQPISRPNVSGSAVRGSTRNNR